MSAEAPDSASSIRVRNHVLQCIFLSSSLFGLQIVWSTEFAQAAPYLLQLGMSKSATSLVFLAGPLSGLIIHPLIGAYSDRCTSSLGRRRPFIIVGSVIVALNLILLAWCRECAALVYASGSSEHAALSLALAVISIYFLDFAINVCQATDRALMADVIPAHRQSEVNIWAGRMHGIGAIMAFLINSTNLTRRFSGLANTQIKILSIFCSASFVFFHFITCASVREQAQVRNSQKPSGAAANLKATLLSIWTAFRNLSTPIWRVLCVQLFAWSALFSLAFYSTTWVGELYLTSQAQGDLSNVGEELASKATRAGSRALLGQSIVSFVASIIVPLLAAPRLETSLGHSDAPTSGVTRWLQRLQRPWLTLSRFWMVGQLIMTVLMLSAWLVRSVLGATLLVSLTGVPLTISLWIPFALLGELIPLERNRQEVTELNNDRVQEVHPFLKGHRRKNSKVEKADGANGPMHSSGTILGLHNMAVVIPQFFISMISSLIFSFLAPKEATGNSTHKSSAIGIIFFIGGLAALVSSVFCYLLNQDEEDWRREAHLGDYQDIISEEDQIEGS